MNEQVKDYSLTAYTKYTLNQIAEDIHRAFPTIVKLNVCTMVAVQEGLLTGLILFLILNLLPTLNKPPSPQ